ncbi:MAG: hypothetical protein KIS94_11335 [Chitinophagales bacterium]|nr:hypothetical protein [Chitinophagales bacterium]
MGKLVLFVSALFFIIFLTGCKNDVPNAVPKIIITKPYENVNSHHYNVQTHTFDFSVYDADGLSEISYSISGGPSVVFFQQQENIGGNKEFSKKTTFKVDSVYGKSPMKCSASVTATDTKGATYTQVSEFKIYKK